MKINSVSQTVVGDAGDIIIRAHAEEFSNYEVGLGYIAEATITHRQRTIPFFVVGSGSIVVRWVGDGCLHIFGSSTHSSYRPDLQREITCRVDKARSSIIKIGEYINESRLLTDLLLPIAEAAIMRKCSTS